MSEHDHQDTEEALRLANNWPEARWQLWLYRADSTNLVLHAYDERLYLVFRRPSYVRLPLGFAQAPFPTAQDSTSLPDIPPPGSCVPEGSCIIVIHSGSRQYCVVCQSVGFHQERRADVWTWNADRRPCFPIPWLHGSY